MPQDPMIARAAAAARIYGGKQDEWFIAPAPCCGINVRWFAVASNGGDYSRTKVDYTFSRCGCAPLEEIA